MFGQSQKKSSTQMKKLEEKILLLDSENSQLKAKIADYESKHSENKMVVEENKLKTSLI